MTVHGRDVQRRATLLVALEHGVLVEHPERDLVQVSVVGRLEKRGVVRPVPGHECLAGEEFLRDLVEMPGVAAS